MPWIPFLLAMAAAVLFLSLSLWGRRWSSLWFFAGVMVTCWSMTERGAENILLDELWIEQQLLVESSQKNRFGRWEVSGETREGGRWVLSSTDSVPVSKGSWAHFKWEPRQNDLRWYRGVEREKRESEGRFPRRGKVIEWGHLSEFPADWGWREQFSARWVSFRWKMIDGAEKRLSAVLGSDVGGAALAVVLGERRGLDEELSKNLRTAGTFHLFAISGMHLSILSSLMMIALRLMGWGSRGSSLLLIALLWCYAALCGMPVSVQRATMMATASLFGPWFARKSAPLHALLLAGVVLLWSRPADFGGPAFLLSFGATAGIISWNSSDNNAKILPDNPLLAPITVSFAAFAATLPILAHYFHQANSWTLLANLPSCPLMSLFFGAVLAIAVIPRDLSPVLELLSDLFGSTAQLLYKGLALIAKWASDAPGAVQFFESWPALIVLLWYAAYFSLPRWKCGIASKRILLLSLALLIGYWAAQPIIRTVWPRLELQIIDIGQGDAVRLQLFNNRSILIDTGPGSYGEGNRLVRHLQATGGRPDLLIITHPHADHWGGVGALIENGLLPRWVILPKGSTKRPSKGWLMTIRAIEQSGATIDSAGWGEIVLDQKVQLKLSQPGYRPEPLSNANDLSLVLEVVWDQKAILLTGDLENRPELRLARREPPQGELLFLKAGHHGSANATQELLLDRWNPKEVAISCGQPNRYKHPTPAMMKRVLKRKIPLRRTDEEGTLFYRWR